MSSQSILEEKKEKIDEKYIVRRTNSNTTKEKELTTITQPFLADLKYDPTLKHLPSPNRGKNDTEIIKYKKENQHLKGKIPTQEVSNPSDIESSRDIDFVINKTFYGDIDGSCPNDNTIAVSKNGRIISMMNGEVGIFKTDGSKLDRYNLYSFFNEYIGDPCDPLVQYDANADRFIMFVQACGDYKDKIAFGFSTSNNPAGNWYIYVFESDILDDGSWCDYPKLAITRDEVFLGINLFGLTDDKYKQSILFQLDKQDGFAGNSLTYKVWENLEFTPMPITSGISQYYPGAYVLSSESAEGTSLTLYDVTNNLGSADLEIITYNVPVEAYKVPLSASQYGSTQNLDSGDSRMQSGYYQNKIIHAVHTASDAGYAVVKYYRINPSSFATKSFTVTGKDAKLDYCYPAVLPFTKEITSDASFIAFHASGTDYYPMMRGKVFNHDFTTIASQLVKSREGSMTDCYNSDREYNRWGDYMGLAYHYGNTIPTVWMAGSLASNSLGWVTYIAEANVINVSRAHDTEINTELKISPNPTTERFNVLIETQKSFEATFTLINEEGKLISTLYKGGILTGENKFSFDTSNLNNGYYYLLIKNNKNEIIKSDKIIITH